MSADRRQGGRRLGYQAHVAAPVPQLASGRRPRVSVIVPCHNYGRFLPGAVGSARFRRTGWSQRS